MSGRHKTPAFATHTLPRRALCALVCGLACGFASAEPPKESAAGANAGAKAEPPPKDAGGVKLDPNPAVPADAPKRKSHETFRLDTSGRIFTRVEDFKPVARETENSDEYQAWNAVVVHAKRFPAAELEAYAAADLTPADLLNSLRGALRYELIRFDGKLVCVRRLPVTQYLKDNPQIGIGELYEARFVPLDESPQTPVSLVFTDLPDALRDVAHKPFGEWVDRTDWVTAAGFFFKTMNVPGEHGNAVVGVPVLVGRGVTLRAGPPEPVPGDPTALDPNVRVYKSVRDDVPLARSDTPWQEVAAYNRVVVHASRFTPEQLEAHALADVKFADLYLEARRDYRWKNVKLEGRLVRVRRMEVDDKLKAAGVEHLFEGWLIPPDEPRGNPVCVVYTEPLAGVEPGDHLNVWASFAGFSFKRMRYESAEPDPKHPGRYLAKQAPLLIGRGPIRRAAAEPALPVESWGVFVNAVIVCGALLVAAGGLLAWYYRRGDRKAKAEIAAVRTRNPFAQPPDAPDDRAA
jgi:hypothetical protein